MKGIGDCRKIAKAYMAWLVYEDEFGKKNDRISRKCSTVKAKLIRRSVILKRGKDR